MTDSIADILDRAADLIEPEGAWTQGTWARDADENPVRPTATEATCFCAKGAIERAAISRRWLPFRAYEEFRRHLPGSNKNPHDPITLFNDAPGRTQSEVVAKLREAASLARSEEGE